MAFRRPDPHLEPDRKRGLPGGIVVLARRARAAEPRMDAFWRVASPGDKPGCSRSDVLGCDHPDGFDNARPGERSAPPALGPQRTELLDRPTTSRAGTGYPQQPVLDRSRR